MLIYQLFKELMVICHPLIITNVVLLQLRHKNAKVDIYCNFNSFLHILSLKQISNIIVLIFVPICPSQMREDSINVIIFALLTFPSNEFGLENLITTIGPHVTDQKKRVRQASMECLALLAQCLGPAKV